MKVLAVRWAGAPTHCVFPLNYSPALLQALLCCTPHYLSSLISPCGNGYGFGNVWCTSYIVCNRAKGVTLANPREKQSNFSAVPSWKWRSHIQQRTVLLLVFQSHTSGIVGRLRCRQEVVPLGHLKQVLNCITAKGSYLKSLFWRLFTHIYAYTHTYKDPDQDEHLCLSPDNCHTPSWRQNHVSDVYEPFQCRCSHMVCRPFLAVTLRHPCLPLCAALVVFFSCCRVVSQHLDRQVVYPLVIDIFISIVLVIMNKMFIIQEVLDVTHSVFKLHSLNEESFDAYFISLLVIWISLLPFSSPPLCMCVCVLGHVCMNAICMWVWRPEESIGSCGAGVKGSHELPDTGAMDWAEVVWRTVRSLNCWANSPAFRYTLLWSDY